MEHMGMGRYGKILKTLEYRGLSIKVLGRLELVIGLASGQKTMQSCRFFCKSSEWTLGTHSEIPSNLVITHGMENPPVYRWFFPAINLYQRISKRHVGCLDATCHTVAIESPWSNSIRLDSLQKGAWIAMLCYAAMPAHLQDQAKMQPTEPCLKQGSRGGWGTEIRIRVCLVTKLTPNLLKKGSTHQLTFLA